MCVLHFLVLHVLHHTFITMGYLYSIIARVTTTIARIALSQLEGLGFIDDEC